ncbi:MAG: phosphoenolpyruvate carboxykinase (GTP) [Candidatus Omnitrophica bacterium]|nr:phosphoenolpyruvate carboxykinase (GTP) [Candidatus Omnitrophota bacterium]
MTNVHGEPNAHVKKWVEEMRDLCQPDAVYWCDGSEEERRRLMSDAVRAGDFEELNQELLPGCYLHRSAQNDVARTEGLTFICTRSKSDAGPTNNWMAPDEAYRKCGAIFKGSMKGRQMYVIPFIMGPAGSPFSKVGIELTDSLYVVLNMRMMTRMGNVAWGQLGDSNDFTRCLHGKADLNIDRRFICHFPEDNTIWSVGSGYGGNALLGKKCLALRIAGFLGRREGWMAEHMLIVGIEDPQGRTTYITAAFPSACGKTNLAMLVPPASLKGYKVWTVGDDIAWLRVGKDGQLWAVNPENGFFGVAPGTSMKSNPNAMKTIQRNSFFTNVVRTPEGGVWWEGMDIPPPQEGIDWKGKKWTPSSGEKGAHPNSRFTAPASQCPSLSPHWEDPEGVPISAIIFGGRRASVVPLVFESFDWPHGTYVGATVASERTAAAEGTVGELRHDPMAMLPFCGYHMGDYFEHWLQMGKRITRHPKIFHVNWFRQNSQGEFLWPGFGENLRVIQWILERCAGSGKAVKTPIGFVPAADAITTKGTHVSGSDLAELLRVDPGIWKPDMTSRDKFFGMFDRLPQAIRDEHAAQKKRLHI